MAHPPEPLLARGVVDQLALVQGAEEQPVAELVGVQALQDELGADGGVASTGRIFFALFRCARGDLIPHNLEDGCFA